MLRDSHSENKVEKGRCGSSKNRDDRQHPNYGARPVPPYLIQFFKPLLAGKDTASVFVKEKQRKDTDIHHSEHHQRCSEVACRRQVHEPEASEHSRSSTRNQDRGNLVRIAVIAVARPVSNQYPDQRQPNRSRSRHLDVIRSQHPTVGLVLESDDDLSNGV